MFTPFYLTPERVPTTVGTYPVTKQLIQRTSTSSPSTPATTPSACSPSTHSVFVSDVAVPRLVEMSAADASIISVVDLSSGVAAAGGRLPGFIDLKASGAFLYALAPGNGATDAAIVMLDVSGGQGEAKAIQRFSLRGVGGKNSQGLAILD